MAQRRTACPDADIERAYRKERAHRGGMAVWRVPTKAMEALRGVPALPPSLKRQVTARSQAASCAVSGAVSLEIARQLGALAHDSAGSARVSREGF